MNTGVINISNTITTANAESANITGNLEYSCTNTGDTAGYVSVCLAANGGNTPNAVNPRYMNTASNTHKLAFDMTLPNGKTWGTRTFGFGEEYSSGAIYIPARSTELGQSNISDRVVISTSLIPNNGNALAIPGTYTNNFNGDLTFKAAEQSGSTDCLEGAQDNSNPFSFTVQATVIPSCEITAKPTDINLNNIAASAINTRGSTSIGVNCTNGAPYTIGLTPSNGNENGKGDMTSTSPNSDVIPYQLQSVAGTAWGNTLTAESVGNGVAYNGTGVNQSHTVYAIVPSADVKPDHYSDIVTISVNY
ncbi:spore coat U domain-containing protein [Psychrobacter sp. 4Dc]|uniref:Csu type fimbrial protein n=1 Tax=Psychrobacter sp. 4Dc TaxID=888437 RepID=UPI0018829C13|nr:spore coat U domain-containing protein [Psychrobacter sp. 4Dc]